MLKRVLQKALTLALKRHSVLLLGPRQTGKTTVLKQLNFDMTLNLAETRRRLSYEKNPGLLADQIRGLSMKLPIVYIDEIQKVPALMDEIQVLIDEKVARFCLTGSSARKLRKNKSVNMLPGRLDLFRMDPLSLSEIDEYSVQDLLVFGSLPAVYLRKKSSEKEKLLRNYVELYLQEEVREEALVRNMGVFSRFLELAAIESGNIMNFSKISQDIGVSSHTIQNYFSILEDCLIVERIDPISESRTRKKLSKSSKYLFFDLGVRRIAAREPAELQAVSLGSLFEQWVALEIIRFFRNRDRAFCLKFWSDPNGPEVDWIIEYEGKKYPIEVKWSENISVGDSRHLRTFKSEYENVEDGIIVYRGEHNLKLANGTVVISPRGLSRWLSSKFV